MTNKNKKSSNLHAITRQTKPLTACTPSSPEPKSIESPIISFGGPSGVCINLARLAASKHSALHILAAAIPSTDKSVGGRDSLIFRHQSRLIFHPSGKSRRGSGKLRMILPYTVHSILLGLIANSTQTYAPPSWRRSPVD